MRTIINISMPPELKKDIDRAVREGQYASTSEFFRDILRLWKKQRLYDDLQESQKEIKRGKGKILRSLRDVR